MTLIIALACKNGIVMASDGQATAFSSGGPVRQKYQKIYKIKNLLFGASGTIGTIQRCRECVEKYADKLSESLDQSIREETINGRVETISVRDKVRQLVYSINKRELERYKAFHDDDKGAPLADILIVLCSGEEGKLKIWHVAPDGGEEFLDELGYACTGIGDTFAYAYLANFYSEELDVERGKLVAYRVIKDAINIGAYGLGEPIDIWTVKVTKEDGNIKTNIRQLSQDEIFALNDAYLLWKESERKVFDSLRIPAIQSPK